MPNCRLVCDTTSPPHCRGCGTPPRCRSGLTDGTLSPKREGHSVPILAVERVSTASMRSRLRPLSEVIKETFHDIRMRLTIAVSAKFYSAAWLEWDGSAAMCWSTASGMHPSNFTFSCRMSAVRTSDRLEHCLFPKSFRCPSPTALRGTADNIASLLGGLRSY